MNTLFMMEMEELREHYFIGVCLNMGSAASGICQLAIYLKKLQLNTLKVTYIQKQMISTLHTLLIINVR